MTEREPYRLQIQTVGLAAIEHVPADGMMQSFRMGTMHAQLMRAPCTGLQGDPQPPRLCFQDFIHGHCLLPINPIHPLPGSVLEIGGER